MLAAAEGMIDVDEQPVVAGSGASIQVADVAEALVVLSVAWAADSVED